MSGVFVAQFQLALNQDHNLAKAFDIVESAPSRIIAGHLRATAEEPSLHNERTRQLESRIAEIQLTLLSSASSSRERGKLLRALDEAESGTVHVTGAFHSSLASVQSTLSVDELLLEYVVSDNVSFVLAVTKNTSRAYHLPGGKELASLVRGYTDEVSSADPLPESSRGKAKPLFVAALSSIKEINNKNRLIIVPDGALDLVGFDSLVDKEDKYLVRTHTISYAPSATVLQILRNPPV